MSYKLGGNICAIVNSSNSALLTLLFISINLIAKICSLNENISFVYSLLYVGMCSIPG